MTAKENLKRALKFVGVAEGGDNFVILADGTPQIKASAKNDSGGLTRMGVTEGTLRSAHAAGIVSHEDITKLTKEEVELIYTKRYWEASMADELPWPVALIHFDAAVNCGLGGAAKMIQRALVSLGVKIEQDGIMGDETVYQVNRYDDQKVLAKMYIQKRINWYSDIVARRPSQQCFLRGWLNRIERLKKEAGVK